MWVFLNSAFLSIVQDKDHAGRLMVRARLRGDIQRVFPHARVTETPLADYRFRAAISRVDVAAAVHEAAMDIDYTNFKKSVPDQQRHHAYLRVWGVMQSEQEIAIAQEEPRVPSRTKARLGRVLNAGGVYLNPLGKKPARPRSSSR